MRVIGFVALACALLTCAACAEDEPAGRESDGGGTAAEPASLAVEPGSYEWLLRFWGPADECIGKDCPPYMPAWSGGFEVTKDGTVSGTGKLGLPDGDEDGATLNPYVRQACISGDGKMDAILPEQDVELSGNVAGGGEPAIQLEFSADVLRREKNQTDCRPGVSTEKEWAMLDPFLQAGETRTARGRCATDGKEDSADSIRLKIQGVEFEFTCW